MDKASYRTEHPKNKIKQQPSTNHNTLNETTWCTFSTYLHRNQNRCNLEHHRYHCPTNYWRRHPTLILHRPRWHLRICIRRTTNSVVHSQRQSFHRDNCSHTQCWLLWQRTWRRSHCCRECRISSKNVESLSHWHKRTWQHLNKSKQKINGRRVNNQTCSNNTEFTSKNEQPSTVRREQLTFVHWAIDTVFVRLGVAPIFVVVTPTWSTVTVVPIGRQFARVLCVA